MTKHFFPEWDEGDYADHSELLEANVDESYATALRDYVELANVSAAVDIVSEAVKALLSEDEAA